MLQHLVLVVTSLLPFSPIDVSKIDIQAFTSQADSECKNAATGAVIYQCGTSDLYPDCDSHFTAACSAHGGSVIACSGTCTDIGNLVCDDNNRLYADCDDFETECENNSYYYLPVTGSNGTCVDDPDADQHFCCSSVSSSGNGSGEDCTAISDAVEVINACNNVLYCDGGWTKEDGTVTCSA